MDQVLHQLVEVLRRSEIRISPAETLDAFKVLRNVGIDNKSLLREALALTLAKSIHEKIIFYETFDEFFTQWAFQNRPKRTIMKDVDPSGLLDNIEDELGTDLRDLLEKVLRNEFDDLAYQVQKAAAYIGVREISSLREKAHYVRQIKRILSLDKLDDYFLKSDDVNPTLGYLRLYLHQEIREFVEKQYRLNVDPSGKRSLIDAALRSNLDQIPVEYHSAVRDVVQKIAEKLTRDRRRVPKRAVRGLLDIRRTIRKNIAYDGSLFKLYWRRQRPDKPTVFVLCDVSNSVARISRFLLLFLYELTDVLPNIRSFVFSSDLGEVTDLFKNEPSEKAIEETIFYWGKGATDYTKAFGDFRKICGKEMNQRSTIIVLGDARNNYYDLDLNTFKDISKRVKQVFWLNPEARDSWSEGDSVMLRYKPFCFRVDTCNRIDHMERFADRLIAATR